MGPLGSLLESDIFTQFVSQIRDRAIIALAPDGEVLTWNAGAEALKRYTASKIIGRNFRTFYTHADRESGLPDRLLEIAAREGSVTHVGHRVRGDGSLFWGEVNISSVRDDDGTLVGFAKVTKDVSERRDEIARSRRRLQEIVHDVRAPLSAAVGLLELAAEGATDPAVATLVDRARTRLLQSVELLQPIGTSISGNTTVVRLEGEHVQIADAAAAALADLSTILDVSRVMVAVDGVTAPVAPIDLDRVLTNLISNAIKYSSSGPISIEASVIDGVARLTVSDTGEGIHPDDLPHVFESEYRGRDTTNEGMGIGLASVREVVRGFGGDVQLESTLGTGTTVTVTFPADP